MPPVSNQGFPNQWNPLGLYQFPAKLSIMKRRKLSEKHCDRIIRKYQSGTGYGRISRYMKIPKTTIRTVIQKCKQSGGFAHLQAADNTIHLDTKTPSVKETSKQTEEHVDDDHKWRLVKKEQRTVQSRCRLEHLNTVGQVQSAASRPTKRIHSCGIAGAVIAATGRSVRLLQSGPKLLFKCVIFLQWGCNWLLTASLLAFPPSSLLKAVFIGVYVFFVCFYLYLTGSHTEYTEVPLGALDIAAADSLTLSPHNGRLTVDSLPLTLFSVSQSGNTLNVTFRH